MYLKVSALAARQDRKNQIFKRFSGVKVLRNFNSVKVDKSNFISVHI